MRRAAALVLVLLAAPSAVAAQLEDAERAEREGRLIDTDQAYRSALDAGGLAASDAARAHLRLGVLARALGADPSEAARHFAIALAIDPTLDAPAELPPEERARFESQRGVPYRIVESFDGRELRLEATGEPAIARAIRVRIEGSVRELALVAGSAVVVPPNGTPSVEATMLDEHGNALHTQAVDIHWPDLAVHPEVGPSETTEPLGPRLECPLRGDPCGWPPGCRTAGATCNESGQDPAPIIGGVVAAVLGAAAAVVIAVVAVEAWQSSLWRIDRAGLR